MRHGFGRHAPAVWALCLALFAAMTANAGDAYGMEAKRVDGKPFVKWVGGKGQLREQLLPLLPEDLAQVEGLTYIEPFVGGGAMLFEMLERFPNIERAVINDRNSDLMTVYRVVKECPQALIARLEIQQAHYYALPDEPARKAFYLAERERYNTAVLPEVERAALFIFLNRTCYNGLYRVNAKGYFNVPFGKAKRPLICDKKTLLADSLLLQKVTLLCGDFTAVEPFVKAPAFLYFDPPYRPLNASSSFTAYAKGGFDDGEQVRLAAFCRALDCREKVRWLLSNSDPHNADPQDDFFERLYRGFELHRVQARRNINSNARKRGAISELVIRNYGATP